MKIGDLVKMPGCTVNGELGEPEALGVVVRTDSDGINRGTPHLRRIQVWWIQEREFSWEPVKWLETISKSKLVR